MYLSKSKYTQAVQCNKILWLDANANEERSEMKGGEIGYNICGCCGKIINNLEERKSLRLIDGGNYFTEYEGELMNMGLPIGYYTSQWFANFFLQDFDHFVKEKLQLHLNQFLVLV